MPFFGRSRKRTLVIGLDGVPHSLLTRFTADGTMPNMARLAQTGHLSKMKVTLPEISAVSWPSFMTGTNPGTHGIFGFVDWKPGTYDIRFPNYGDLKAPTIWDRLGERKKRSVVLNQPSTYPAREIEGVLVSGFVAISLKKAVWPIRCLSDLEDADYRIDIDTTRARDDHDYLLDDLERTLRSRMCLVDRFWKNEDWDYFQIVITGTDRIQHYIWEALDDPSHRLHGAFIEYYRKVDRFVGELVGRFNEVSGRPEGEGLFLLSDHGFCGITAEVRVNRWLMENGFLSFDTEQPSSPADVTAGSRAFALDPGRIYIHRKDRFPKGGVDESSARAIVEDIKAGLGDLTYEGRPVIEHVFERDEVYSGPAAAGGPDLLPVGNHGFDLKGTIKEPELFGRTNLTGMHTWDDAFFWSKEAPPSAFDITNLASIILRAAL